MTTYYYKTESGRIQQSTSNDCHTNVFLKWQPLKKSEGAEQYRDQCRADLVCDFGIIDGITDKNGNRIPCRIYANVTSVARSGMSRTIEFYRIQSGNDGQPWLARITHLVAGAQNYPMTDNGLKIGGCGMDMVFAALDGLCGIPANNFDIRRI